MNNKQEIEKSLKRYLKKKISTSLNHHFYDFQNVFEEQTRAMKLKILNLEHSLTRSLPLTRKLRQFNYLNNSVDVILNLRIFIKKKKGFKKKKYVFT